MVFNQQKMISLYLASKVAPRWYIQLNMFLNIGGNCPIALP